MPTTPEYDRDDSKKRGEEGREARRAHGLFHACRHRPHIGNGCERIDATDRLPQH